jgi:CBS domain-containing protein
MNPNGTVSEILAHKGTQVWLVSPDATVFDAIQMMAEKNVGALLVTEGEKLVGIISERDYTRKVALKGKSSKQTAVREILSGQVIHVAPGQTVEECLHLMTDHRIRHLPVLQEGRIVGIISIGDLVNWVISAQNSTIHQLQTYISGVRGCPGPGSTGASIGLGSHLPLAFATVKRRGLPRRPFPPRLSSTSPVTQLRLQFGFDPIQSGIQKRNREWTVMHAKTPVVQHKIEIEPGFSDIGRDQHLLGARGAGAA